MAKWTFEQQSAIELRHTNLLISAAAGSGKTAVLVERITQLVRSKEAEIHKLLIVTYTNAAASEMRGRIEASLSSAIEKNDGDAVYQNEQIKLLNRASIKTFHAFCLDVIRNHFQKVDCDPGFKMLSEPERVILVRQAIEEVLEIHFEKEEPAFLDLVEAYSGNRNDEKLIELILQIYYFIQSQPHPKMWLDESYKAYSDSAHPMRREWSELLRVSFIEKLEGAITLLEKAIELCALQGGPEVYIPTLESDIRGLSHILEASEDMTTFRAAVLAFKFDRIASIKKNEKELYDEALVSEVKESIRDKIVKKQVFESIKSFFDYKTMERFESEIDELKGRIEQLNQITVDFSNRFQSLKKKRNVMDFNDLEHYAIEILEDPAICESLKQKFDYIFVDEYQDSSGIQEHIINKICRKNNVFMVGDVKQSIYKFRLADPELFIEKYKRFDKLDKLLPPEVVDKIKSESILDYSEPIAAINARLKASQDPNHVRIDLRKNFRTRGEVLTRVNRVFEAIMSEKLGEIEYDSDAKLYPGMAFENAAMPYFEINILSKKMDEGEGVPTLLNEETSAQNDDFDVVEDVLKTEELEANAIANAIKARIGTLVFDPKSQIFKPCTYRDIVVLLRSSKSWTPTFEQVFLEAGIPLFADSNTGYFDTLEIKLMMELLKIIDNPLQDLALLTVLRSPMVNLSIEEIVQIKAVTTEKRYFYLKCLDYMEQTLDENLEETVLKEKISKFIVLLTELREKSLYLPLDELVWLSIQKSDFYYYVSAMPGGVSRQSNLRVLVDRATALKSSKIITLGHFIEFVDKMSSSSGDFGVANVISEEDNVVRLMSIHKSKGLEFPIVILSGLGRKFNFMDAQGDLIQHKRLGMGLSAVDLTLRVKSKTLPQFVIREQIRRETLSEEMRVLYVGLTRAVDQILLFATVPDYQSKLKQWQKGIDLLSLTSAGGFIDWIMPALLGTDGVKVTVQDAESVAVTALDAESLERTQINKWFAIFDEKSGQLDASEDQSDRDEISKRLAFQFERTENSYKPLKVTVSDKKKELLGDEAVYKTPALYDSPKFLQEILPLTPAETGTVMHLVFEKIDLHMRSEPEPIESFIQSLLAHRFITERERDSIELNRVQNYLNSNLATRLRTSLGFYRETPFVLKMDDQLVQGIIDLYFEEEDGLILVDYKTDRIKPFTMAEVAERYRGQLEIYERALSRLSLKHVKEKYIYFIESDTLYQM